MSDRFSGVESRGSNGWPADSKSNDDKTMLARLPVITAVEMAPGTARRRRPYWHAMADTAIIAATLARNPTGSTDALVLNAEDQQQGQQQKLNQEQQPREARTTPAKPA